MISGLFAGCVGKQEGDGSQVDKKDTEKVSETDTTEVSAERELVNNVYTTGLPIVKDPVTVRIAIVRQPGDQSSSTAVKPFAVKSEKDTNIKFDWIDLATDVNTQISVMLAGGDMPDAFIGGINQNLITLNYELFTELEELLPKYGPNTIKFYEENDIPWKELLTFPNGHIYSLMGGFYTNYQNLVAGGIGYINEVWIKNAELEHPKTTDELYNVLKAFKEKDVDLDGDPNNEIPFEFCEKDWAGHIRTLQSSWGITGNFNIDNGKIVPTMNTQAYRDYLEYCHKLYKEGLINQEGFSQTSDQFIANIKAMKAGLFFAWASQTYLELELAAQYAPLGVIKAPGYEDKFLYPLGSRMTANLTAFVISASSKYKEVLLRWWDYLQGSEELRMLTARGIEGYIWEYGEDGKTYLANPTPEEKTRLIKEAGLAPEYNNTMTNASFYIDNFHPLIINNLSYHPPKEGEYPSQGYARQCAIDLLVDYLPKEEMPKTPVPADKLEEYNFKCQGLEDYINSFRAKSIMEGVTDESWNEYLKNLKEYNYDFYIEFNQKRFDGSF